MMKTPLFKRALAGFIIVLLGISIFPAFFVEAKSASDKLSDIVKLIDMGSTDDFEEDVPLAGQPKVVKVGYFYDDFLHKGQGDGEIKSGYGYEYYQMIANYTGWSYEYVYGSWQDVYNMFLDGEIDIMDDITITTERKKKMYFSSLPMGEEHYYLFVLKDNKEINLSSVYTLNGKKIGVNADSYNEVLLRQFIEERELDTQIVLCSGEEERMEKLLSGEIDGMVTTDGFSSDDIRPTFRVGYADFYFAVNKTRSDLLSELNHAILKIYEHNPNYNNQLKTKYQKSSIQGSLDENEKKWLETHPVIKVGYRKVTKPLCDIDPDTGELIGVLKDLLEKFSNDLGVEFEAIPYDDNNTLVSDLNNDVIDAVFPVLDNVWFSEQLGYRQTFGVTQEKMALVYPGEYKGITNYKKYSYVTGSPAQLFYIIENNLTDDYVEYPTVTSCMDAVLNGDVDCSIINSSAWKFILAMDSKYEKLNIAMMDNLIGYSFGVGNDDIELLSILENSISQLDHNMVLESVQRNSQEPFEYSFANFIKHNLLSAMVTLFIIIIVIVCMIIFFVKDRIHKQYLSYNSEHDGLTGVYNRAAFNRLTSEIASNADICFAMVDIDEFKTVNDTYGHDVGDEIIKKVANQLTGVVRSDDKVFRFGGDEFVVILFGIHKENEEVVIRKINKVLENLQNPDDNLPATSISVGAAFSELGYSKEVFENADAALYETKEKGKKGCTISNKVIK